ncbi:MAG: hypothetical protein ABIP39_06785, partial [Polyangiaceae bacterium]
MDAPLHVTNGGSWLTGLFTLPDGRRVALVVNLDHGAPQQAAIAWTPPPAKLFAVSPIDGKLAETPDYDAGAFRGTVPAGDARLLVWSP